jgi:two-component system response regulator DctR
MPARSAKLFLIDDDEGFSASLVALFRSRNLNLWAYGDPYRFLDSWRHSGIKDAPAVFIIDVRMHGITGIELFRAMKQEGLPAHHAVVFLSGHGDISMAVDAVKNGAWNFVDKLLADNSVVDLAGEAARHAESCHVSGTEQPLAARLTRRELAIANLIIEGKTNAAIGNELHISGRTVEVHRANLYKKLDVKNVVELINALRRTPT